MFADEVASRLRSHRARLNLTLREVAERTGIHYVSISRYEQGKLPTLDALGRLARLYGVPTGSLIPDEGIDPPDRKRKPKKKES